MSCTLTIAEVGDLRAKQPPIATDDAPYANSNAFKSSTVFSKPTSKRWDHRLSNESKGRKGSTLKGYATSLKKDEIISLGTARPTAEVFPWDAIDFHEIGSMGAGGSHKDATKRPEIRAEKGGRGFDLGVALNYGHAAGSAQLVRFFTEHTEIVHNPPYSDWECGMTCGNTSALELAIRTFCNPGDHVLCEEYTYPGAVEAITPLGVSITGVKMDSKGLMAEDLDNVLTNWDPSSGPKPFLLYIIPTGHNPTGITQPAERRREIYEIAEKHDLYIVEDDPYFFLQLNYSEAETKTNYDFLNKLPPSYLSLDRSGRVLRLDSTSKIIAPGLRCGWMTGASQIIQKIISHHEVSVVTPSGVSQIMLYKLVDETWGHSGFLDWLISLSKSYRARRDILLAACQEHIPQSVCTWEVPDAGMFIWLHINWQKHPSVRAVNGDKKPAELNTADFEERIFNSAVAHKVIANKGSWFRAERGASVPEVTFRLTFAAAPENTLAEAAKRLGEALRAEFELA